ncbi:MAG: C25 family cysteine peptidase [Candidatus Hermodarchaeota archaeon]
MKKRTLTQYSVFLVVLLLIFLPRSPSIVTNSSPHYLSHSSSSQIDYLIITPQSFLSVVQPLATWKQQRGLITSIITVEEISQNYEGRDLGEAIRTCITHLYEENNLTWVLLAGGHAQVPTRFVKIADNQSSDNYVTCDHYYANLDNNWVLDELGFASILDYYDWDAEVYVGRLPAETSAQMAELINRLLNYERSPPVGSWMKHAIFAGAFANFNEDYNNNNQLDENEFPEFDANRYLNWLKANLLPPDWDSTFFAETEGLKTTDYYYDKPLNEDRLIEEINSGATVFMLSGHGSTEAIWRYIFSIDYDNDSLFDYTGDPHFGSGVPVDKGSFINFLTRFSETNPDEKYGFYYLSACHVGSFELNGDCLAEHILRTSGIGCIASSHTSWYEDFWYERVHAGWYDEGLAGRFFKQLWVNGINQPGKAFVEAKLNYVHDRLTLNDTPVYYLPVWENKTLTQFNLLGDPEVPLWTSIPPQLDAKISFNNDEVVIEAVSENQPISTVCVTLSNSTHYWRAITDSTGQASFPIFGKVFKNLNLTLSKNNYLPYQEFLFPASSSASYIPTSFPELLILFVFIVLIGTLRKRKGK